MLFFCFLISHVIHTHKRAERRARNIAGAEALAVARRPEVASREKNPAAAGIRRFFPLSKKSFFKFIIVHGWVGGGGGVILNPRSSWENTPRWGRRPQRHSGGGGPAPKAATRVAASTPPPSI